MSKAKTAKRVSVRKPKPAPENFDDYLAGVPESARKHLLAMRASIRSCVPAEAEEIISYGIPAFRHKKVLVWFAAFSKHCSLFPSAHVLDQFQQQLAGFHVSKGTIQFPLKKPLPIALIKKLVKARVAQAAEKS
jgi:uncharacterized protein YdhG (YjbR/CyaY superfamily)